MSDITNTAIEPYLAKGFEMTFIGKLLAIKAPSEDEAYRLASDLVAVDNLARTAKQWQQPTIPVVWAGCKRAINILQTHTLVYQAPQLPRLPNFDVAIPAMSDLSMSSDGELAWAIDSSQVSACITRVKESKILYANFAVSKTHGKPVDEAIGQSIDALWHPDELERLQNFIDRDGIVRDIEYWSWKWSWDEEKKSWARVRQNLIGSFWRIQYKGVPCRLSVGVHEA